IDPRSQSVDRRRLSGSGNLHETKLRPISLVAHELRVDGDEFGLPLAPAEFGQSGILGNEGHCRLLYTQFDRAPTGQRAVPAPRIAQGCSPECRVDKLRPKMPFARAFSGEDLDARLSHSYLRAASIGRCRAGGAPVRLGPPQARPRQFAVRRFARSLWRY